MKYLRLILLITGILNFLEAINVAVNQNIAMQFGYEVDYITHAIFHVVMGAFFVIAYYRSTNPSAKALRLLIGIMGLTLLGNGISIIANQQEAIKLGYHINYLLHAGYYLILGTTLVAIFLQTTRKVVRQATT